MSDRLIKLRKEVIPECYESSLANSCESLFSTKPFAPVLQSHMTKSHANSAGTAENDFMSVRAECDHRLDYRGQKL